MTLVGIGPYSPVVGVAIIVAMQTYLEFWASGSRLSRVPSSWSAFPIPPRCGWRIGRTAAHQAVICADDRQASTLLQQKAEPYCADGRHGRVRVGPVFNEF